MSNVTSEGGCEKVSYLPQKTTCYICNFCAVIQFSKKSPTNWTHVWAHSESKDFLIRSSFVCMLCFVSPLISVTLLRFPACWNTRLMSISGCSMIKWLDFFSLFNIQDLPENNYTIIITHCLSYILIEGTTVSKTGVTCRLPFLRINSVLLPQ